MAIRISLPVLAVSALTSLSLASAAQADPISLVLPQGDAFAILGHSCGGIQEQSFATGYDTGTGLPAGDVYMQTRCGGSGRGGGYHVTTYSAWAAAGWGFTGAVTSYTKLSSAPTVDPSYSAYDAHGDQVYNQSNRAYLVVAPPAAPTGVELTPAGGSYHVSWSPDPTAANLITSSTVTAVPQSSSAPVVTATVAGAGTGADIGPLNPLTEYEIIVTSSIGGSTSSPSDPATVTTPASTIPPKAPTGVRAHWTSPGEPGDLMYVSWKASGPGDSPTDAYRVRITGSHAAGTFAKTVSASTLHATFSVNDTPDWTIRVKAHDAAGWGAWSASFRLGGA